MKKEIHPEEYRFVVFKDISNDYSFLTKSTAPTKDTVVWEDGTEYPLFKLEISHKTHPFYTGKMKLIDTAGRVDRFKSRFQKQIDTASEKAKATQDANATVAEVSVEEEAIAAAQKSAKAEAKNAKIEKKRAQRAAAKDSKAKAIEDAAAAAAEEAPVVEASSEEIPATEEAPAADDAPAAE
ncbi:MAG: type B 50S ribosomal protein L31 [Flavobacteriales bacterium]|nr:type B 50S ribosomal protein L31 [Flavobacteriales bacterium]